MEICKKAIFSLHGRYPRIFRFCTVPFLSYFCILMEPLLCPQVRIIFDTLKMAEGAMKPPPGFIYTQPEGAGKPRRPGNGCFAALALKYTWRYICAYFQLDPSVKICPLSGKIPFRRKCSDFIEIDFKMLAMVFCFKKTVFHPAPTPRVPPEWPELN